MGGGGGRWGEGVVLAGNLLITLPVVVSIYDGDTGYPISRSFSCEGFGIGLCCVKMVWQPASTFSSAGELGMVLDRGHLRLPQVTDRNRKLCCLFCSFEPTVSKVVLSAGPTVLKSCYS